MNLYRGKNRDWRQEILMLIYPYKKAVSPLMRNGLMQHLNVKHFQRIDLLHHHVRAMAKLGFNDQTSILINFTP
jgi:putative heme iron utilization protein